MNLSKSTLAASLVVLAVAGTTSAWAQQRATATAVDAAASAVKAITTPNATSGTATPAAQAAQAAPAVAATPSVSKSQPAPGVEPKATTTKSSPMTPSAAPGDADLQGLAVVYSDKLHGRSTASGERYSRRALTAAHKTLPFGTTVRVTHNKTKRGVTVRINDRGPFQAGRVIDLSQRAAKAIGIGRMGSADVTLKVVKLGTGKRASGKAR